MGWKRYSIPKDLAMQELAFDPVLPPKGVPDPLVMDENGTIYLQVLAPEAKSVAFQIYGEVHECKKDSDGIWRLKYPGNGGISYIHLRIDGTEVLSPYLPIGYGCSRPANLIFLPEEDEDFYRLRNVPHGKLIRDYFFSSVTGEWQRLIVYLPPNYEEYTDRRLPVLYLQHGHGENEIGWSTAGKVPFILDNLLADEDCVPFAVIMNNGMVQKEEADRRVVDFKLFDEYLTKDVIPFIEQRYRVGGEKSLRAMAGLSMGSLQTSISGFLHPELFCALGVFSGFLQDWIQGSEIDMVDRGPGDNRHLVLLKDPERFNREFDVFFRAIGDQDIFLPQFEADDVLCEENGIRQVRRIYEGVHDWNVWRRCIRDFAQMIFCNQES